MSSQNAGTNSPKNEQADPMGSSTTEGQQGKTSQGLSGEEQRSHGMSIPPTSSIWERSLMVFRSIVSWSLAMPVWCSSAVRSSVV